MQISKLLKNGTSPNSGLYSPKWSWQHLLIGRPLQTADAPHQLIGKLIGLAVFASDALSSSAYATQEIMMILAIAGASAMSYVFPISIAIFTLMVIVTISYEQTVHAYPTGGGAYIVARENLGELPATIAGAALLTDYILTVAVSISSGVSQIASAFPELFPYRVTIAVVIVFMVMMINLRGVKESGTFFAIPTYFFILTMASTVVLGLYRYISGSLGMVNNPPELSIEGSIGVITPFLLLHAFASGTAALTGIEAISNGITAFKEPRSKNAGITLIWMSVILGFLFLGISFLAGNIGAVPSEGETVISQIARTVFPAQSVFYFALIIGTAVILFMAANTAFADFPRLSALAAGDGFLPRQLAFRGSRLVFSWGIMALAVFASLLIILFNASVTLLIPLYAIGVFLSFTISQAGMARHWWKSGKNKNARDNRESESGIGFDPKWILKMVINGFGSVCTLIVMFVFGITKFKDGAWIIIFLIPSLVLVFYQINNHYKKLADKLSLSNLTPTKIISRHRVILLIAGVHNGSITALSYARSLSPDLTAVHVSIDEKETQKVKEKWAMYGEGTRLVILESPYRLMIEPLMEYINKVSDVMRPNELLTVVVPQFVPRRWWENLLHNQTALQLRFALLFKPRLVILEVPYQV